MGHRIREAMRAGSLAPPMGGNGGIVEIDVINYNVSHEAQVLSND